MGGAAFRVARLRAREIEHRDLYGRERHARGGRGSDEPRRRRQGRRDERRRSSCADRSPRPTRSSRFATASTPWPPPARPPSSSPAARCATRKSSPRRTNTGLRWFLRGDDTSGTDDAVAGGLQPAGLSGGLKAAGYVHRRNLDFSSSSVGADRAEVCDDDAGGAIGEARGIRATIRRRPGRAPAPRSPCRRRQSRRTTSRAEAGRASSTCGAARGIEHPHAVFAPRDQHARAGAFVQAARRAARIVHGADRRLHHDFSFVMIGRDQRRAPISLGLWHLGIDQQRHARLPCRRQPPPR